MKKTITIIVIIYCMVVSVSEINATIIGTHIVSNEYYLASGGNLQLFYGATSFQNGLEPAVITLFPIIPLDNSVIGNIYKADINTPGFNQAVTLLTNGTNNYLGERYYFPGSIATFFRWESGSLEGHDLSNPDFKGSVVTSMQLTIDNYSIDPTFPAPDSYQISFHVDYFNDQNPGPAATPEPDTVLLFGTGLVGLAAFRSRRKK